MIDSRLLQLLFAFAFIALAGFTTYKITLPIGLKIIDLCLKSQRFSTGMSFFLAVVFCIAGIDQLNDFVTGPVPNLSRFFPLSFISSGLLMFVGFKNYKLIK